VLFLLFGSIAPFLKESLAPTLPLVNSVSLLVGCLFRFCLYRFRRLRVFQRERERGEKKNEYRRLGEGKRSFEHPIAQTWRSVSNEREGKKKLGKKKHNVALCVKVSCVDEFFLYAMKRENGERAWKICCYCCWEFEQRLREFMTALVLFFNRSFWLKNLCIRKGAQRKKETNWKNETPNKKKATGKQQKWKWKTDRTGGQRNAHPNVTRFLFYDCVSV